MTLLDDTSWHGKVFSDGWTTSSGGDAPVREPATGDELARTGIGDAADVDRAVRSAQQAQTGWARTSFEERAAILRAAGRVFEEQVDHLRDWIVRETGGIPPKADLELHIAAQECFEAAALTSQPLGEIIPSAQPRLSLARRRPVGVVGVISPFNFPLILSIRSVAPALALGNAVVLKPDARTSVAGGLLIARAFEEAGLPQGVLHVLPGGAETGAALVEHPGVPVISFTGSTAAGRKVGEAAGRLLKRAHLELGGNSALVVLDDADLDLAVSAGAFGSFMHQGQICMTTGRHLVHESIADEYVGRLVEHAQALPVGDPFREQVALGPLIDAGQRDRVHALVTASVDAGAKVLAGGEFTELFYRPTVLADVTVDTPAYAQEVFGPVAPVMRFATLDEAAALAANTEYGLSLGILSRDVMKAYELAERIPSGIVHINDQTVGDEAVAPFGGVAASGTGSRFGGAAANIDAFTDTQWLTLQAKINPYPF
ncbi:benzaldehyde dehydrogenase [Angustibacter sp. McL0619]|uniref:benzaldehyde dehydrogenase n=1 Tax=Angustibacter sp. McL0619 TaxID=3415676 RepID=UPI003CE678EE